MTVIKVAWILAARCFSPTDVIHLEYQPWDKGCRISTSFVSEGRSVSALELNPEDSLADFVHNVHLAQSLSALPVDNAPSDEEKQFLTTVVRINSGCPALREMNLKAGVSLSYTKPKLIVKLCLGF
jgi:hypothetical protein